jgi:hypothetical protein
LIYRQQRHQSGSLQGPGAPNQYVTVTLQSTQSCCTPASFVDFMDNMYYP